MFRCFNRSRHLFAIEKINEYVWLLFNYSERSDNDLALLFNDLKMDDVFERLFNVFKVENGKLLPVGKCQYRCLFIIIYLNTNNYASTNEIPMR